MIAISNFFCPLTFLRSVKIGNPNYNYYDNIVDSLFFQYSFLEFTSFSRGETVHTDPSILFALEGQILHKIYLTWGGGVYMCTYR